MKGQLFQKYLHLVWYAIFIIGLNSSVYSIISGKLIYIFLLFFMIELLWPRRAFIINIFLALFIVRSYYYPGGSFSIHWIGRFISDIGKEIFPLRKFGFTDYMPLTALCLNLAAIILMQKLFFKVFFENKSNTIFLCLGSAFLTMTYMEQYDNPVYYVFLFIIIGLIIKVTNPFIYESNYSTGRELGISTVFILSLIFIAAIMPGPKLINTSEWLKEKIIYRYNILNPSEIKVGYNAFSGNLGASLIIDNTPVLKVNSPYPIYLRGQTEYEYTGKGWRSDKKYTDDISLSSLPQLPPGERGIINIEVLSPSKIIFLPRNTLTIDFPFKYQRIFPAKIDMNEYEYEYFSYMASLRKGDKYSLLVHFPYDNPDYLQTLSSNQVDPCFFSLKNISKKVQELAISIVEGKTNNFDKAQALLSFLRYGSLKNSLEIWTSDKEGDFIEDFLFKRKIGYCVHFSTAFVLMARSAGLPARWVKGYSYGIDEGNNNYLICNKHAHTWGEIYFDDYGWVPFDPTPGSLYAQPGRTNIYDELIEAEGRWASPVKQDGIKANENEIPKTPAHKPLFTPWLIARILLIGLILFYIWKREKNIQAVYKRLQFRLRLFSWQKYEWETPREHLQRLEASLPNYDDISKFVEEYEKVVYGGNMESFKKYKKLIKNYSLFKLIYYRFFKVKVKGGTCLAKDKKIVG